MGNANSVVVDVASEFVCRMYAQKNTDNVNEARYKRLMQATGKVNQVITVDILYIMARFKYEFTNFTFSLLLG